MLTREPAENSHNSFVAAVALFAAAILFGGLTTVLARPDYWLRRIARREIASRPGRLVNPNAPGVHFVAIVPRSNWENTSLVDKATDIGFLAVDAAKGALFFEGDNLRYRIPAAAIIQSGLESYTRVRERDYGNTLHYFHLVVITVKLSDGSTAELPFRLRAQRALFFQEKQRLAHYELLKELNRLKTEVNVKPAFFA